MALTPQPPPSQQATPAINPVFANLFKSINNKTLASTNYIKRGSLISFSYGMWVHDPYPLLLVTDAVPNKMIRGVNLHYMTFPFIKNILRMGCGQNFSYAFFKNQPYIVSTFRSYKWQGIRQVKLLDCNFLLTVMATVRSFDPSQVAAIRQSVQEQIRRETNPQAAPTGDMPVR